MDQVEPESFVAFRDRLEDAVLSLGELRAAYFEPKLFRRRLNASIQELRNTTFILQKCGSGIPGFSAWYQVEQGKLKADKICKWLIESRNEIVKRGELRRKSVAEIQLYNSWLSDRIASVEVPPELRASAYASRLSRFIPERFKSEEALIHVTRRWVHESFPDHEITALLAHCASALCRLAQSLEASMLDGGTSFFEGVRGLVESLERSESFSSWFRLCDRRPATVKVVKALPVEVPEEEVLGRYGEIPSMTDAQELGDFELITDLQKICGFIFAMARKVLRADGYHSPKAFLWNSDGEIEMVDIDMEDRAAKHIAIRALASRATKIGTKAAVLVNESWVAPADGLVDHAVDHPDRQEGLLLSGISRDGEAFNMTELFDRLDDRIWFISPVRVSTDVPYFMRPIAEAIVTGKELHPTTLLHSDPPRASRSSGR